VDCPLSISSIDGGRKNLGEELFDKFEDCKEGLISLVAISDKLKSKLDQLALDGNCDISIEGDEEDSPSLKIFFLSNPSKDGVFWVNCFVLFEFD